MIAGEQWLEVMVQLSLLDAVDVEIADWVQDLIV